MAPRRRQDNTPRSNSTSEQNDAQASSAIRGVNSGGGGRVAYDIPSLSIQGNAGGIRLNSVGGARIHASQRAASAPQMAQRQQASDVEGRRVGNRLGYRRASVACAWCRHRKIRCLRSSADPQEPCQNCQASGRECVFEPPERRVGSEEESPASNNGEYLSTASRTPDDDGSMDGDGHFYRHPPPLTSGPPNYPYPMAPGHAAAGPAYAHPSPLQSPNSDSSPWQYPGTTIPGIGHPQFPPVLSSYPPQPPYMPFHQPSSSADVAPFHSTYAPHDPHSSSPYTPTAPQPMWQTNIPFQHAPPVLLTQPYANESAFAPPSQPYASESAFAQPAPAYANETAFAPPLMMPGQGLGLRSPHQQQFWRPQQNDTYDPSRPESGDASARRT